MVATAILCAFSVYEIYRATGTIENEVMFTVSMLIAVLAAFVHIPRSEIVLTGGIYFCNCSIHLADDTAKTLQLGLSRQGIFHCAPDHCAL